MTEARASEASGSGKRFVYAVACCGGIFGPSHYATSKAAVIGLCQAAARELGPYGITSNAIAPAS